MRRVDPDRWLSSRFIGNAEARADVMRSNAFDHELARRAKVASNALLGENAATWWRERWKRSSRTVPLSPASRRQALRAPWAAAS